MSTPLGARTGGNYRGNTTTLSILANEPRPRPTTGPVPRPRPGTRKWTGTGTKTDPRRSVSALFFDAIVGVAYGIDGTLFVLCFWT